MCGIISYVGHRQATTVLLEGLKRLEYRGYDSAGIAVVDEHGLAVRKTLGRVDGLKQKAIHALSANLGIAHTRWATHGRVHLSNAHPHTDAHDQIAVVHNGIIDNVAEIRERLTAEGVVFRSETDTEVLPHLIARNLDAGPIEAVRMALAELEGTWGLAIAFARWPGRLLVARQGSPLVIGLGDGEMFVASDAYALAPWVNKVIDLEDGDMYIVESRSLGAVRNDRAPSTPITRTLQKDLDANELGGWTNYMIKEIHEQSTVVQRTLSGRLAPHTIQLGCLLDHPELADATSITLLACGSSYYTSCIAAYQFEALAGIPARAELASEFVHREPLLDPRGVYIAVSQSGETFDTLQALERVRSAGIQTLGVVNVVGSSIARRALAGVYLHAGRELAVASTKSFTAQLAVLSMLSAAFAERRGRDRARIHQLRASLRDTPDTIRRTLAAMESGLILRLARWIDETGYCMFLGRGMSGTVAAEGALKLKELAYIPCDAYSAGEMKHGPIAMIDEGTPVIGIVPNDRHRTLILANLEQVRARGARLCIIHESGDEEAAALADLSLPIASQDSMLSPMLTVLPLQLLAYHVARLRGCDVDKPRNLAKSVTVA